MKLMTVMFFILTLVSMMSLAEEEQHSHQFPKYIKEFHDVMAPLWHAESSEERKKSTCEKINKMNEIANKIDGSKNLISSLNNLSNSCKQEITIFDDAFSQVHHAFHEVSE